MNAEIEHLERQAKIRGWLALIFAAITAAIFYAVARLGSLGIWWLAILLLPGFGLTGTAFKTWRELRKRIQLIQSGHTIIDIYFE